jgi:outer membrane protein TolC
MKVFGISFLICLSFNGAMSQKINNLSLRQTVDYAMTNAIAVKNALLDIKIQQQTNREITAIAFPQINTNLSVNDYLQLPTSLVPAEFAGGTPGTFLPLRFGTKYNVTGGIDFTQLLFDGQVFVGLKARKSALQLSNQQAAVTAEMIKENVYKLYYQLLIGIRQMGSIDANIDRFDRLLHDTKEIYSNGFAEKLDVDKVSVQLNNLQTEKIKLASRLEAGNAALKFLINMPQAEMLVLTDTLREEQINEIILTDSVHYEDVKSYQLLKTALDLANYNVQRYKLSAYPTLAMFISYNQNAQRTQFDFLKSGDWFPASIIGLKLQVPLFGGFAKDARIEKAKFELEKTKNSFEQVKASVDNNVTQSKLMISASIATVESQRKNMKLAEQVYLSTKLKYEQGLGSQQEIYNAQTELKVAQNNYYGALYDAVIAGVDYRKAIGKL